VEWIAHREKTSRYGSHIREDKDTERRQPLKTNTGLKQRVLNIVVM